MEKNKGPLSLNWFVFWLAVELAVYFQFYFYWVGHRAWIFRAFMLVLIFTQVYALVREYLVQQRRNRMVRDMIEDSQDAIADSLRGRDDNSPYERYTNGKRKIPHPQHPNEK